MCGPGYVQNQRLIRQGTPVPEDSNMFEVTEQIPAFRRKEISVKKTQMALFWQLHNNYCKFPTEQNHLLEDHTLNILPINLDL